MRKAVVNTTPLIALSHVGQLGLLKRIIVSETGRRDLERSYTKNPGRSHFLTGIFRMCRESLNCKARFPPKGESTIQTE